ncbi:germinal center-associated signaling and motility protein isoform X3 [Myotis lucifugus]|uniref:germinal center-associated signaling and motility protein isoform X3 n=1 Tax=Myotis lucifugus TaxID=59463 RepID=UPI000CCBDC33|nr:germinal center-associated signaling and motility protein isoform X3 [Myotis lucifugus]
MGNSLLRENRWQQNTQEIPWHLRNQNLKQRTSRKKMHIFKARQDFPKEGKLFSSTSVQDNADQNSAEELCYTLIDHRVLGRRPSGNSAEEYYENVPRQVRRPRESLRGTETEYSLLHVPPTPRHPPAPEGEYELLSVQ